MCSSTDAVSLSSKATAKCEFCLFSACDGLSQRHIYVRYIICLFFKIIIIFLFQELIISERIVLCFGYFWSFVLVTTLLLILTVCFRIIVLHTGENLWLNTTLFVQRNGGACHYITMLGIMHLVFSPQQQW